MKIIIIDLKSYLNINNSMDEIVKKTTKFIIQNDNEYLYRDEYNDKDTDDEDDLNDYDDYEYIINNIKNQMIGYVEENYLPLCEYLSYEKIEEFLSATL